MSKPLKIASIIFLLGLLFLIRNFETILFYDPLQEYFKNDYLYGEFPDFLVGKLLVSSSLRYFMNTVISLGVLWILFKKRDLVFSIKFYTIAFFVLIGMFSALLLNKFQIGYLLPFYIRRFLIHPLFLFLLIPAFFYQKKFRED